jgi:hypothetical protein
MMEEHHNTQLDPNPPEPIKSAEDWERATGLKFDKKAAPKKKISGLGDIVEKVAQPIAKSIDRLFGTNIKDCGGCKNRKNSLNKRFPIT